MAPQHPPLKQNPVSSPPAELANTPQLGAYWTTLTSRRPSIKLVSSVSTTIRTPPRKQKPQLQNKDQKRVDGKHSTKYEADDERDSSRENEEEDTMSVATSGSAKTRLPKAAATYDAHIKDPELRTLVNGLLFDDGHIATYVPSPLSSHSLPSSLPSPTKPN